MQAGEHSGVPPETCVICCSELGASPRVQIGQFRLMECPVCGSWTGLPRPDPTAQHEFHDTATYFEHPYLQLRRANLRAIDRRCKLIFSHIAEVQDLSQLKGQRLLDVGCDTGQFLLSAARLMSVLPVGVDVSQQAISDAKANGIEAYVGTVEEILSKIGTFKIVTAIDLIEHLPNPVSFFQGLSRLLQPGGIAYVESPNQLSAVYSVGRVLCGLTGARPREVFERLFPSEHIQYFSPAGLTKISDSFGLKVIQEGSKSMPASEIAVGTLIRAGLAVLQGLDHLYGHKILTWALLQRSG